MRLGTIAIAVVALALAGGCVNREAQAQGKRTEAILNDRVPVVETTPAQAMRMEETLEINGQLATSNDSSIGAKVAGRVVSVLVRDGDSVSAGQAIAIQDTSALNAQLRQALAQVAGARAQLSQAQSNKSIAPKRSEAAVRMAEASLASAKSQLKKAQAGARAEERRQAEIAVDAAKSGLETAKKEMERQKNLYEQGATSQQRYEVAQNNYQQALANFQSALERLEMTRNATRPEDLSAAQEAVRQAEESLRTAKASKELDVVFDDQVAAARATLQSALAGVDLIQSQISDATIRAPYSGRISGKPAQVGQVLAPGSVVARLVGAEGVYFEGEVSETRVGEIQAGKSVEITLPAFPDRTFSGTVVALNPLGEQIGRIFRVRIALNGAGEDVKPGMFATGKITLRTVENAVAAPITAIITEGSDSFVFVLEGTKVRKVKVVKGLVSGSYAQAIGLTAGARVVTTGQVGLRDGVEVKESTEKTSRREDDALEG